MRGYGLQKNAPIRLSFNRENYEGLIERHGQWVRWLRAKKCTCVLSNGRPDLNCPRCGGDGWVYETQKTAEETLTLAYSAGSLELPYVDAKVLGIYDYMGLEYQVSERYGKYCKIIGGRTPAHGEKMQVIIERPLVKTIAQAQLNYHSHGCFSADGLKVAGYKGVANENNTAVEILSCSAITNVTRGITYTPVSYRRNMIFVDFSGGVVEPAANDVLIALNVQYIEPFLFAIVGQQQREPDWKYLESIGGDASMTFPHWAAVGEGDIITVLADSQVGKRIIERLPDYFDTVPEYYLYSIDYIEAGADKYYPGQDFDLWGANKIRWYTNVPQVGTPIFVMYRYCPTYRVIREFPNVRSGENQQFPRRVALKLLQTYAERKPI